jgi:hypothetical protein
MIINKLLKHKTKEMIILTITDIEAIVIYNKNKEDKLKPGILITNYNENDYEFTNETVCISNDAWLLKYVTGIESILEDDPNNI